MNIFDEVQGKLIQLSVQNNIRTEIGFGTTHFYTQINIKAT
jgi:hypothetical protein